MTVNPIFTRELSLVFSRRGALPRLLLFAGAVAAAVWLVWPRELKLLIYRDRISQLALGILGGSMRLLIVLVGPAYSALSVTRDREQGSQQLIASACPGARQIYYGKFLAAAVFLWMLLAATMPMAAAVYLLGGVSLWTLAAVYLEFFLWAAMIAAYGVSCSALAPSSPAALARAYSRILPIGALWLLFPQFHPVWILGPILALPWILQHKPALRRLQYPAEPLDDMEAEQRARPKKTGRFDPWALLFGRRRLNSPMSDWASPVLTRELRYEGLAGAAWIRRFILLAVIAGSLCAACLIGRSNPAPLWCLAMAAMTFLLVPALSASAITREFDQRTFDTLIVTPLRPVSILWPKIYVAVRTAAIFVVLSAALAAAVAIWTKHPSAFREAPACLAILFCTVTALAVWGVFVSLASRSTSQATVAAYGAALPFAAGPLVCWLMGIFSDLPASTYAWTALASPATPLLALAGSPWTREILVQYPARQLVGIYCGFCLSSSLLLFVVMALGFDYFWKKGPLQRA